MTEPITMNEALSSENTDEWKEAIEKEYIAHVKNKTWKIVDRPEQRNIIGSRFVFKTKLQQNGKIEK